ncbi:conserved hypothetical protein [Ricinus communis]|uniref:Uncharacterized protein n=1 Tax=Ricinus communis TaxID=3988 RepID=B9TMJ8_RICCO|nr:conserved hypothetical protein [Ricinus communis]
MSASVPVPGHHRSDRGAIVAFPVIDGDMGDVVRRRFAVEREWRIGEWCHVRAGTVRLVQQVGHQVGVVPILEDEHHVQRCGRAADVGVGTRHVVAAEVEQIRIIGAASGIHVVVLPVKEPVGVAEEAGQINESEVVVLTAVDWRKDLAIAGIADFGRNVVGDAAGIDDARARLDGGICALCGK